MSFFLLVILCVVLEQVVVSIRPLNSSEKEREDR